MSEPLRVEIPDELLEAIAQRAAELVRAELEAERGHDEPAPFLTVAQYAERHQATPAAVRARIRRGALEAMRPPGGREYLIPNDERHAGGHDG